MDESHVLANFDSLFPAPQNPEYHVSMEKYHTLLNQVPHELKMQLETVINETRVFELVDAYRRGFMHGFQSFNEEQRGGGKVVKFGLNKIVSSL